MVKRTSIAGAAIVFVGGIAMASTTTDPQIALNLDWAAKAFSSSRVPFSFTYGGRPSSEFLGSWRAVVRKGPSGKTKQMRTLTLTDPVTRLEVQAAVTAYADSAGVDWTLTFTNRGDLDTAVIENVRAVDDSFQAGEATAPVIVHRINGGPCRADDFLPFDQDLPSGRAVEFAATGGRSSNVFPFFNVSWRTGGVITAIGWSGQWNAGVERAADGSLRIQAGMERTHLKLHPGESVRSPRIMQIRWAGEDPSESYNLFRRTMLAHVMPRIAGKLVTPPITTPSPWAVHEGDPWKYIMGFTAAQALDELKTIKGLGYEFYWTDAYYTKGNFPDGMGNYGLPLMDVVPDLGRFPQGLKPIADAAHRDGLGYVVWFEPERVAPGTYVAVHHPEFVISPGGNGSGLLNLGMPEARKYIATVLSAAIDQWGIDCLRIDYNLDPLPYWEFLDSKDPDRVGIAEIRYVEGLYRLWDDLRMAHPRLFIDDCASGGRRIDLETCSRSIALWRTDATIDPFLKFDYDQTALQNQVMTAGLNRYIPYSTSGTIGAKPYHFRSGFNYGAVLAERPIDAQRGLLKAGIAEGKRLRKYWLGDFYPLSPVTMSEADWCVMQYNNPKEGDGVILAFRRPRAGPSFQCRDLHGIDPEADYLVTMAFEYVLSKPVAMRGSALKNLALRIDDRPGSVVVEYRRSK